MPVIAVLSRFQNDAHVRVINLELTFTMDDVAAACAEPAVDRQVRHPDRSKPLRVRHTTEQDDAPALPRSMTVSEAGFRHFECIDVFVE
jgi:Toluene-4-monooxygenase system protein B (TmoB)